MRSTPPVERLVHDLADSRGICKVIFSKLSTAQDFFDGGLAFHSTEVAAQTKRVEECLRDCLRQDAEFVLLPELSVPRSMRLQLRTWGLRHHKYVAGGFEVDSSHRNAAFLVTPAGELFEIPKVNPSAEEVSAGVIPGARRVQIFRNSPFESFAILTCLDLLDDQLIAAVRGEVTTIVCPAYDKSSRTFDHSKDLAHRCYSWVLYCNNAVFAESRRAGLAPVRKAEDRTIVQNVVWEQTGDDGPSTWPIRTDVLLAGQDGNRKPLPGWELVAPPPDFLKTRIEAPVLGPTALPRVGPTWETWEALLTISVQRLMFGDRWKSSFSRYVLLGDLKSNGPRTFTELWQASPLENKTAFDGVRSDLIGGGFIARRDGKYVILSDGEEALAALMQAEEAMMRLISTRHKRDLSAIIGRSTPSARIELTKRVLKIAWDHLEALAIAEECRSNLFDSYLQDQAYQLLRLCISVERPR